MKEIIMIHAKLSELAKANRAYRLLSAWVQGNIRIVAPLITLTVILIFFSFTAPRFVTYRNALSIIENMSSLLIVCAGITVILLIAEIDLSFANVMTFMSLLAALLLAKFGWSSIVIIFLVLLVGTLIGAINGYIIAYLSVPSFAATLAMMQIAKGLNVYITKGVPIFEVPPILHTIGVYRMGGITLLPIIAFLYVGIFHFVLRHTRFGSYIYAVGGNIEAARLAGINTNLIRVAGFAMLGISVAVAGLFGLGRTGVAQTGLFEAQLLDGIAAVVIGGTSLFGGEGGIPNTIIGVLIWYTLRNGLDLMDISIYIKTLVTGVLLLLALIFNVYLQRVSHLD